MFMFICLCFIYIFRLNALEYSDLRGKLQSQVQNARNIVVRQSLSDQFLEAFRTTVQGNPLFRLPLHMVKNVLFLHRVYFLTE